MCAQQKVPSRQDKRKEKTGQAKPVLPAADMAAMEARNKKIAIGIILTFTFLAYLPVLQADFVNWDDGDYAYDNAMIRSFSNIGQILTTPVQGNYHPLTMLSLALNYFISGNDAWSYHLFNLIFHLINCVLVFRLAYSLSKNNIIVAYATALLFGIHPFHVESVAWVAERKDVLYGLFFVIGLHAYVKYVDTDSKKQYGLTLLFLVLSLLSKPAAVIFPVALFSIDLLRRRPVTMKLMVEKIPFFIFAAVIGILTYVAQEKAGATKSLFPFWQKTLFATYGIMMYTLKTILPFKFATFYAFPPINLPLPTAYFLSPVFSVALAGLFFYSLKRNRVVAFGILFFLINLLLVLQIVTVGGAVMADRYTYIPLIGLFFIGGWYLSKYAKANFQKANRILIPLGIVLAILTFRQASTWDNGASLWEHAIKTAPSARAYTNRGNLLLATNSYDSAFECFNNAVALNIYDNEALTARGNIYFNTNRDALAYADYKRALAVKPDYATALDNLGVIYISRNQLDSALDCFNRALVSVPNYKQAYRNRGYTLMQLKQHQASLTDFKKFLTYQPEDVEIVNLIGSNFRELGQVDSSLSYINKAIAMKPLPDFYVNRANTYLKMNQVELAKQDALKAKNSGLIVDPKLMQQLGLQ